MLCYVVCVSVLLCHSAIVLCCCMLLLCGIVLYTYHAMCVIDIVCVPQLCY